MIMHRFQKDTQAVSIIIGALMLTVIVVSAATAFAIFTSQKQKDLLDAEYAKLRRDLEEIVITSITDISFNGTTTKLENISVIITSLHAADSTLSSLSINGNYLRQFNLTRQDMTCEEWKINSSTGQYQLQNVTRSGATLYNGTLNETNTKYAYYPLNIASRERIVLTIKNASTTALYLVKDIHANDAITISIYSSLVKEFTKTFIPPTAIIRIITESQWNPTPPGSYDNYLILDGSSSDHPGTDAYIISWQWDIEGTPYTGRKIHPTIMPVSGDSITLTVTDNYGMTSTSTITYP